MNAPRDARTVGFPGFPWLFGTSVALLLAAVALPVRAQQPAQPAPAQPGAAPSYEVTARPMDLIPYGTPLSKAAPPGWNQIIVKSQSRLAQGAVDKVPQIAAKLSSLLSTVLLARVRSVPQAGGQQSFALDTVAIGVGADVGGKEIIVSGRGPDVDAPDLGFFGKMVLSTTETRLKSMYQVARSPTSAVLDCAAIVLQDGKHENAVLRYAVLVDPRNGGIYSLAWLVQLDSAGKLAKAQGPMQWLPPNLLDDCQLHVDANGFVAGIPTERAFAICRIPAGRPIEFSPALQALAGQAQFTAQDIHTLESQLWLVLVNAINQDRTR